MKNKVSFQLEIEAVGDQNVRRITADAKELGRMVKEVTDELGKLNTKLLDNMNNIL